ncbi:PREDICTED: uncharacterized protein LOC109465569 [Branchiostoma belcheri]|uniref:Uncharacterized protein LOC109465569 n=1 Tax=Branchiostoma belcheri TaxID=7741 RepID=A0A6P4YMU8_BRABE|nr:PREDICTED: uncharacterized protein LOC109465569 [Branchiostoma belcheri]
MEVFPTTSIGQTLIRAMSLLGVLLCLYPAVSGVADITMTSRFPYYPDTDRRYPNFQDQDFTWLYCYYTGTLLRPSDNYWFKLELDTGSGRRFALGRNTGGGSSPPHRRVRIWPYDRNDNPTHLTNAYSCLGRQNGVSDKVITFKMREDADVRPRLFSRTVNVGDAVTLEMVRNPASNRTGALEWRKDGVVLQGQTALTLNINNVQSSDEGIYECYYDGAYSDRKQGIVRLIVRACAENKYGSDCSNDCPDCYNGGVCHDQTGECVCPPGFNGTYCGTACASGRFGKTCRFSCSGGCQGQLMTVPDPVGCTCPPGLTGMTCQDACPDGTYGASCTQNCHCLSGNSACHKETGACAGGCAAGWEGDSCQIMCPIAGYVSFNGVCYKDFADPKTYDEARQTCAADGGLLAMPKNSAINTFIGGGADEVRTDTVNEAQWVFADGQTLASSGYSNWYTGEPNNANGGEHCAETNFRTSGEWNDAPCSLPRGFICQIILDCSVLFPGLLPASNFGRYQNQCFWFSTRSDRRLNYRAARQVCGSHSGTLAMIKDAGVQTFVTENIKRISGRLALRTYWMGLDDLNRERRFVWNDGTPLGSYRKFRSRANHKRRDCGALWRTNRLSRWVVLTCWNRLPYICQMGRILVDSFTMYDVIFYVSVVAMGNKSKKA